MKDAFIISALSVLPKKRISHLMGGLSRLGLPGPLLRIFLRWFIWKYNVDLSEAERPLESYTSVVDFFTRALKAGARPVDPAPSAVVSPADGKVYACGVVQNDRIPQSDDQYFSARELLGGRTDYEGGSYAVIYLSPRDYHRVHTPCSGRVEAVQYLPGELWPVFPVATKKIPFLFSRNERLTAWLATSAGELALVMVGAFGVGRMRVVFDPIVTNEGGKAATTTPVSPPVAMDKAAEIGRFEMGSTVVLVFPPGSVTWTAAPGQPVRVGERIGTLMASGSSAG